MTNPGSIASQVPAGEDYLIRMIQDLQRQINEMKAASSLNAATIDSGGLTVTGGSIDLTGGDMIVNGGSIQLTNGGHSVFYAGNESIPDGSGRTQQVVNLTRDDGTAALQLADNGTIAGHTHQQALQWYDRAGNIVLADDTNSGIGIARPHVPLGPFLNTNTGMWPSTTAASWTTIANCYIERQHPRLSWALFLFADAATTGQFRILCAGTQVGSVQSVSNAVFTTWTDTQPFPSSTGFGAQALLELQAQVTAGTGAARGQQLILQGVQS